MVPAAAARMRPPPASTHLRWSSGTRAMAVARAANQAANRISPMKRNGGRAASTTSAAADARSHVHTPSSRLRQSTTPMTASALGTGGYSIAQRDDLDASVGGLEPDLRMES